MGIRSFAAIAALALTISIPAFAAPSTTANEPQSDEALAKAVASHARAPANVARDRYRHPLESLTFWGLAPKQTILEIWPGAGYWAEILAPYAKTTGGKYIAAVESGVHPLPPKFIDDTVYGNFSSVVFDKYSGPLAPPRSVDFVLTARNIHDWMQTPGLAEKAFHDFYAALKPGGILAVEQHRADPRPMVKNARDGYVSTAYVIKLARDAGFRLEAQSEINANPKDTKNYPFGVWTLPPTRQSAPSGKPDNPNFDHSKYDAIGESDRMTLRFRKPR